MGWLWVADLLALALLSLAFVLAVVLVLAVVVLAVVVLPEGLLLASGGLDGHTGEVAEVDGGEELLGVNIDLDGLGVEGGHVGHPVVAALALLLLQLEGDTADGTLLDTPHQVSGEAGNLVAKALCGDFYSSFLTDTHCLSLIHPEFPPPSTNVHGTPQFQIPTLILVATVSVNDAVAAHRSSNAYSALSIVIFLKNKFDIGD